MGSGESKKQNSQYQEFAQRFKNVYGGKLQGKQISQVDFQKQFPKRRIFAEFLYKYIRNMNCSNNDFYSCFELISQVLILNEENISQKSMRNHGLTIFQTLIQICRGKELLKLDPLTKIETQKMNDFFNSLIFSDEIREENKNFFTDIINNFMKNKDQIFVIELEQKLKNLFPVLIVFLRTLIEKMIFQKEIREEKFEDQFLMNNEIFIQLQMCNSKLWSCPQKQLIYSSSKQGSSFHRLAQSLKGLKCPVIILVQNKYNTIEAQNNIGLFGALTTCEWQDSLAYFGNTETFLFSLKPQFKTFFTFNGKGGNNFVYLNTKKINNSSYKVGLGFGGENNEFHRLWIDSNFLKESKIYEYGNTFAEGSLSDSPDEYLQVLQVEIWGFPSAEELQAQVEFRQNENQRILNNRKVDKKEMFGIGTEILLEKQYKFKENMNIDFEYEKEKLNKQFNH